MSEKVQLAEACVTQGSRRIATVTEMQPGTYDWPIDCDAASPSQTPTGSTRTSYERGLDMRIEKVRLEDEQPSPKGFKCMCTFNIQITQGLMLYDLQLVSAPDGNYLVIPPKSISGAPLCSLSPALRDEIAQLVRVTLMKSYAEEAGKWFNSNYFNHQKKAR
ncbi:hypothetical protein ACI2J4_10410 [Agrobacterium tumefaciens]|uniref:hypothetical protein n=1 Tax=Agrobacterium tumefaciens TaxID=358 RepID=UPI00384CEAD2